MVLYLLLCNKNDKANNKWLSLPATDKRIYEVLDSLTDGKYDDVIITNYRPKLNIDFTKYNGNDLYDLNKSIEKLSQDKVTDKEIIALSEIYSSFDDVVIKAQRGLYRFYPNKSLEDVADTFKDDKKYDYCKGLDDEIDILAIVNDLSKQGYQETSTGVILMLES